VGVVSAAVSRTGDGVQDGTQNDIDGTQNDIRVGVSGICQTALACDAVAGVVAAAWPAVPESRALALALGADIADRSLHADLQAGAHYRLAVAPEVIRRAAQSMLAGRG
jgi:CO/xanthine dehydrogenase FAD-binding subunit